MKWTTLILAFLWILPSPVAAQGELRFAELGECSLQNGQVILDCRIGYRTWGTLDSDRSNVILFPTWFAGTTESLGRYIGPDGFVDPSNFFVIAVDAFGNGVSSSPSNSPRQPGAGFPEFTIRDMVDAQHRLLVEELGVDHLRGVIGISMGGMQTFEWLVAYPNFLEKAVPIVGSPQLTSFDLILWETQLRVIEECRMAGCEDTGTLIYLMSRLVTLTPQYLNESTSRDQVPTIIEDIKRSTGASFEPEDYASQLRAMLGHDVAADVAGDLSVAAQKVSADLLTVVVTDDHGVTPEAARTFTRLVGGDLLELDSKYGHSAFSYEREMIGYSTNGFLGRASRRIGNTGGKGGPH
jgi:homoserine O-acetyltransferase